MPKLTDTQTILLSSASQCESFSLYPLPDAQSKGGARVTKAITTLISAGFAEERETSIADEYARQDGDLRYGIYATEAGLAAIGIEAGEVGAKPAPLPLVAAKPTMSKAAMVLALLSRDTGATLADLIAATGWLPHTTRAALTGLRKKGHAIERFKNDGATTYRIVG